MKSLNRRYTRDERYIQVETALAIKAQHGEKPEATAYEIARKISMYPGKNVYVILSEMVALGRLTVRDVVHRPNMEKSLYSLPEGSYELPKVKNRAIKINGIEIIQEELF